MKSLSNSDLHPKIGLLKSAPWAGSTQITTLDRKIIEVIRLSKENIIPVFNQKGNFFHPISEKKVFMFKILLKCSIFNNLN